MLLLKKNIKIYFPSVQVSIITGNQLLLSTTLGGTSVAQLIRRLNTKGVNVAGTSADAAFISGFMIAGGQAGLILDII